MINKLKTRLCREAFLTTPLGLIISPVYIIRNGLYKNILSMAPKLNGDILDFGCGSKPYESLFTNATRYIGIDIETSGHNHKNSKVDIYYDGNKLPFSDNHFDAVVSFEVFEHVYNIDEMLKEIRRVLKPDGKILISIPFAWYEHESPYDFARYTSYGIKHLFEKNLFEVLELKKTSTYVLALCQLSIAYLTQYMLPKNVILSGLFQLLLIFPLNLMSLILDFILPKHYSFFSNCIILAQKKQ